MAATPAPTTLTGSWSPLGPEGFEYWVSVHSGGPIHVGFSAPGLPAGGVIGHPIAASDVIRPPRGMAPYGRADSGSASVTVTQGDPL
jgi:hypothetical protein